MNRSKSITTIVNMIAFLMTGILIRKTVSQAIATTNSSGEARLPLSSLTALAPRKLPIDIELVPESEPIPITPRMPLIELPVRVVGFPVIIFAVRTANFLRKAFYAFNPNTYQQQQQQRRRIKRTIEIEDARNFNHLNGCDFDEVCLEQLPKKRTLISIRPNQITPDFLKMYYATGIADVGTFYAIRTKNARNRCKIRSILIKSCKT